VTTVSPASPGPRLRRATRDDLASVHRIEQSAFPQPWPYAAFEQYLGRTGFIVADDGRIVGYVVGDIIADGHRDVGHIKDLAVTRDRRREGIGSRLLGRAMANLSTEVDAVKLEVRDGNDAAIDLYRRHGFSFRRRLPAYYDNDEDALVLVCGV
jgi:ribosomal-protein-alanine N-acetyltransferase